MKNLKDKVVLVTGASRGIGQYISQEFAKKGSKVICVARTMTDGDHPLQGSLTNTVEEIRSDEGEATALSANISDFEQCEQLIDQAKNIYGPIDVLVNNAALTYFVPVREYVLKRWLKSWEVNLHAPVYLSHLVLEDIISKNLVQKGILEVAPDSENPYIFLHGQSNLLKDEIVSKDLDQIRNLFDEIEKKSSFVDILETAGKAKGVQIFIGSKNFLFKHSGLSMVMAPYKNNDQEIIGAIGVVGPTRLNYSKIVPLVDYTSKIIGKVID